MALNGPQLSKLILAQCSSKGIVGSEISNFSRAMGEGIVESFISMNQVQTMDVGFISMGTGKGKMSGVIADSLKGVVIPLLTAQTIVGTRMKDLAEAVCVATATHFTSMNEVTTFSCGISVGSGVGKVLGLIPSNMENRIMQKMKAVNHKGTMLLPLVKSFSTGFCNNIMATAIVNVVISGSPSPTFKGNPIPGAGSGKGKVS